MKHHLLKVVFYVLLTFLCSCSREDEINLNIETISTFKISDYEFEVNKIVRTDAQTSRIIETTYDTVLTDLCDVCGCEEEDDYEEYYH